MAKFDLRILLETVFGGKQSYTTSGSLTEHFIDTDNELVLSASQVIGRITGSISCSYQNKLAFDGDTIASGSGNTFFGNNTILSASLTGSQDTGSILFTALNTDYDRLLRYKFYGEKVCQVLGLPNDQWVYVDQISLPADDQANYFQGNISADSIFVDSTIAFGGGAAFTTDLPIPIDTGSDRYIKFIDNRTWFENGL